MRRVPALPAGWKRLPAVVAALVVSGLIMVPAAGADPVADVSVIVQAVDAQAAAAAVSGVFGTVVEQLPLVNGVLATVSTANEATLSATPGVVVSPDASVHVDMGSVAQTTPRTQVFQQLSGADRLVTAGTNGAGVTVAVLDTGISALPDFSGRLVGGVDLSGGNNPFQDDYGHGTFVAGLIAGNGASSGGVYQGEAPGANLVAVKVAGASGLTDEATVIQGIQWTLDNAAAYGIRVLNLSLGQLPTGPTAANPLDQAVEATWRHGIVVVASAGNSGPASGTITAPGDDPLVITAGALDDFGTLAATDDSVPSFSSEGPTASDGWLKPDLVISGRSVVSLRDPGSTIDTDFPSARIGNANFVGSGTSFSAAITSGAVALLLQAHPSAAPDEVKARLLTTTTNGPVGNPFVDGHGVLNVYSAVQVSPLTLTQLTSVVPSPTLGQLVSLPAIWGSSSWSAQNYSGPGTVSSSWTGDAWYSSAWNSSDWNSSAFNSSGWNSSGWNSSGWNSSGWNSSGWNSSGWNSSGWNSSGWNSSGWN